MSGLVIAQSACHIDGLAKLWRFGTYVVQLASLEIWLCILRVWGPGRHILTSLRTGGVFYSFLYFHTMYCKGAFSVSFPLAQNLIGWGEDWLTTITGYLCKFKFTLVVIEGHLGQTIVNSYIDSWTDRVVLGWYLLSIKPTGSFEILNSIMNNDEEHIYIKSEYNFACSLLRVTDRSGQFSIVKNSCFFLPLPDLVPFHFISITIFHRIGCYYWRFWIPQAQHYLQWGPVPSPSPPRRTNKIVTHLLHIISLIRLCHEKDAVVALWG